MALAHVEGATEPWIQDLLVALLKALQRPQPVVLECGGFLGHTSVVLAEALQAMGGGTLMVAEWDPEAPERATIITDRLSALTLPNVTWQVYAEDALAVIKRQPEYSVDLCYLDDDHTHAHVRAELEAVWPKMRTNGLICGHDVYGSCDLQQEFRALGGYALDLPRLGPAGGLGIVQVR